MTLMQFVHTEARRSLTKLAQVLAATWRAKPEDLGEKKKKGGGVGEERQPFALPAQRANSPVAK